MQDINEKIEKEEILESSKIRKVTTKPEEFILTDKMLQDLEKNLQQDDNEHNLGQNKTYTEKLKQNLACLQIIRKRIILKKKAYDMIPSVMRGVYVELCRFFLLKALCYEIFSFESILYSDENPLNLSIWDEFRKKKSFAKFLQMIVNMENTYFELMDDNFNQAKSAAVAISKSQAIPKIWQYLNDDPYQNPEPILKVLIPLINIKFLEFHHFEKSNNSKKALSKGLLKICLQLIMMSYEYGTFEVEENNMDHYEIYNLNKSKKTVEELEKAYNNLVM
jgi:hypothetical protein